ncbi:MAG: hypothetical protein JNL92_11695 [Opitutaceae bacterium]|nr:hypothetical protein [Opitutaceae bacterium]
MSEARFTVFATNLTPDATAVSPDSGRVALGKFDETGLTALLQTFSTLAYSTDDECDPHLTVVGRSGTFAIRNAPAAKLLVYDVADPSRNFLRLDAVNIAAFVDYGPTCLPPEAGTEPAAEPGVADAPPPRPRSRSKTALAVTGALAGLSALAVSAQVNFRPEPLDADVAYTAVTSTAEIARVRSSAVGEYRADNETQCSLTIRADGSVYYVTREIDGDVAADITVRSVLALLANQTPVFRTEIGPIEVRDSKTIQFAGEIFTRWK